MLYHAKTFLEKLANFNFTFLFVSKNYLGWKWSSRDIWLHNFGPNWSQITHLRKRGGLGENWLMLLLGTYCALPCSNVSKSPYSRLWVIRLDNFGPNWVKIAHFPQKEIFRKNWLMLIFFIFFCCFKKMLLVDHEVKGCINLGKIGPKLSICSKSGYFWEKQLVHLFCFVMLKCFNKILTADHER